MTKVDAEHTLKGYNHVDCNNPDLLFQTYIVLYTVGVLVWYHALIGRHGAANESKCASKRMLKTHLLIFFMSLTLKTHLRNVFIYGLRQILFMVYLWKFYQIYINKEACT